MLDYQSGDRQIDPQHLHFKLRFRLHMSSWWWEVRFELTHPRRETSHRSHAWERSVFTCNSFTHLMHVKHTINMILLEANHEVCLYLEKKSKEADADQKLVIKLRSMNTI